MVHARSGLDRPVPIPNSLFARRCSECRSPFLVLPEPAVGKHAMLFHRALPIMPPGTRCAAPRHGPDRNGIPLQSGPRSSGGGRYIQPVCSATHLPQKSPHLPAANPWAGRSFTRPFATQLAVAFRGGASIVVTGEVEFAPIGRDRQAALAFRVITPLLAGAKDHRFVNPVRSDGRKAKSLHVGCIECVAFEHLVFPEPRSILDFCMNLTHRALGPILTHRGDEVIADVRGQVKAAPLAHHEMPRM